LTKYAVAVSLARIDSFSIAEAFLKHFICIYKAPRFFLTNQAPTFFTAVMRTLANKFKIRQLRTTVYRPQSNGSIERSHHIINEYLKMYTTSNSHWNEYIATAMFSYNTFVHEGTDYSPFSLVFGRVPRLPSSTPPAEEYIDDTYHDYLVDLYDFLKILEINTGKFN